MLKVEDIVYCRIGTTIRYVRKVERLTKTLAILDDGTRIINKPFKNVGRKYYYEYGAGDYARNYYSKETPELKQQLQRQVILSKIKKVTWDDIPTETLKQILERLKTAK